MDEVLARKYGMSPAQVQAGHERLTAMGAEVGMVFDFGAIQLGNTFDAHRLARAARGTPVEDALVKGLFAAYFTEGRLLSDPEVLRSRGRGRRYGPRGRQSRARRGSVDGRGAPRRA